MTYEELEFEVIVFDDADDIITKSKSCVLLPFVPVNKGVNCNTNYLNEE